MPRLWLILFFLLLAPAGWAHSEDFCGSGLHLRTQICHCEDTGNNLCFCHSDSQSQLIIPNLRETLPVVLAYTLAQLPDPKARGGAAQVPGQQLSPASWKQAPTPRPPR